MATFLQSTLYHDEDGNTIDPDEFINKDEYQESDWFNNSEEINIEEILGGSLFENLLNEIRGGDDDNGKLFHESDYLSDDSTTDSDSDSDSESDNVIGDNGDKHLTIDESDNGFFNGGEEQENEEKNKISVYNESYNADSFFNDENMLSIAEDEKNISGGSFSILAQSIASKFLR